MILHWDITSGNGLEQQLSDFSIGKFQQGFQPQTSAPQLLAWGISELRVLYLLVEIKQEIYLCNIFSCLALAAWQTVFNSGPLQGGSWMYTKVYGGRGTTERMWLTLDWEQQEWEPVPAGSPQAFLGAFTNRQQTWQLQASIICLHSLPYCLFRFFLKNFFSTAPSFIPLPTLAIFSQPCTLSFP